ncbi:hypothetical protein ACP275_06G127000 [Erythranthe tilingii]
MASPQQNNPSQTLATPQPETPTTLQLLPTEPVNPALIQSPTLQRSNGHLYSYSRPIATQYRRWVRPISNGNPTLSLRPPHTNGVFHPRTPNPTQNWHRNRPYSNGHLTPPSQLTRPNAQMNLHSHQGSNPLLNSVPTARTPRGPMARPSDFPTNPTPLAARLRSRMIRISPSEYIIQTFHTTPHLFLSHPLTQSYQIEIGQEREVMHRDREFQYRLIMNPLNQQNEPSPPQNSPPTQNGDVIPDTTETRTNIAQPPPTQQPPMKILVWNCRAANRPDFQSATRDLVARNHPSIFVVLDTKMNTDRATHAVRSLLFDESILIPADGNAEGIWILWNAGQVMLSQVQTTNRMVNAIATTNNGDPPFLFSAVYNYPQPHLQTQGGSTSYQPPNTSQGSTGTTD